LGGGIFDQILFQLAFPKFEIIGWNRFHIAGGTSYTQSLRA